MSVDFSALDEGFFKEIEGLRLEDRVVVRLVQDGFAVVAPQTKPDIVLRALREEGALRLRAGTGSALIELSQRPLPETHLEVAQRAVELVRSAAREVALQQAPPLAEADESSRWRLAALAGGILRSSSFDPQFGAGISRHLGPIWMALQGALTPSGAGQISVLDWQVQAGGGFRLQLARQVDGEALLLGGLTWHRYSLADASASEGVGDRLGALVSVAIRVCWRPAHALDIAVRAAPGLSTLAIEHHLEGATIWRRGGPRLEMGVDVGWAP
ncbi:MAG: hypothetical protein HY901_30530 [Deltaproteobacteria bacterium]|nr:hypothetical protein [Deltaproteobacteria bacterium]